MRSIAAVLSAPIVYGLVSVPVNGIITMLFPSYFDENWHTDYTPILVLMVWMTIPCASRLLQHVDYAKSPH